MGSETSLVEAERDIEATRRRIHEKAELLEHRLKPEALLRPVQKRLEGTLGAGGEKILDAFRDHPLPLALTGLGLGWLILSELRGERARASTSTAGEKVKEKAAGAVHKVRDTAADALHKAKETARRTSDYISATLEERPLLLAVGALAAGLAAAFAVPLTRQEEKALGRLGEKAAGAVLDKGHEMLAPQASPVETDDSPGGGLPAA